MSMTPEEAAGLTRLCALIQREKDPERFSQLVDELNVFLEERDKRIGSTPQTKSAA